jgi:FtsP/CotA-like multicopper oxidase with cupredoxin domain
VENNLDEETTLHWHGLLVPSQVDGGPHNTIKPGAVWSPEITIKQPAATTWFHPHPHGNTARQVYSGLAGMMIVGAHLHPADCRTRPGLSADRFLLRHNRPTRSLD